MKKRVVTTSNGFTVEQIKTWEASDGVNFAIALARITKWVIQVDWWNPIKGNRDVSSMKSLRVYVGDNTSKHVFDINGTMSLNSFNIHVTQLLIRQRGYKQGEVVTKYYSEERIFELPLRVKPDLKRIEIIEATIKNNISYLSKIPERKSPLVPAHIATRFSYGQCALFAAAMQELTGKKAVAIIAKEYNKLFDLSKTGYAHSVVLNANGLVEDIWGVDNLENILERYGIVRYSLDEQKQIEVIEKLKQGSQTKFEEIYSEALQIVKYYFM